MASCKAEYKPLIQYKYFATQLMTVHSSTQVSQTEPRHGYAFSQLVPVFVISVRQVYKLIKPKTQKTEILQ